MTDAAGEVVWSSEYTPFGKVALKEGVLDKAASFTGKMGNVTEEYYDLNSRLIHQSLITVRQEIEVQAYYDGLGNTVITVSPFDRNDATVEPGRTRSYTSNEKRIKDMH